MARVDKNDVAKLARLSYLSLSEEEASQFPEQLDRILTFAERLQGLDTDVVRRSSHALLEAGSASDTNALRKDEPRASDVLSRDSILEAAPDGDTTDGLFKVPRVLPKEES